MADELAYALGEERYKAEQGGPQDVGCCSSSVLNGAGNVNIPQHSMIVKLTDVLPTPHRESISSRKCGECYGEGLALA